MFKENKYKVIYDNIVNRAKNRELSGYFERHHIIPKSLNGDNSSENLVNLTAREHFVCHRLLTKMTEGEERKKMCWALWGMMAENQYQKRDFVITSRTYDKIREEASKAQANRIVTEETREKMKKAWTEERKEKASKKYKGKRFGGVKPGTKRPNLTGEKNGFYGKTHDPEFIERKRQQLQGTNPFKGKEKECPHCKRVMNPGNYAQFHGDKCKLAV